MKRIFKLVCSFLTAAAPITIAMAQPRADDEAGKITTASIMEKENPDGKWPVVQLSEDKKVIYLTGVLHDGSYYRFARLLRAAPQVQSVYLASSGGLTVEGRLIGALVRKYKLDTYVEHYCASACTQIFVAGRERRIGPKARIGFHQSYLIGEDGGVIASKDTKTGNGVAASGMSVIGVDGDPAMRLAYSRAGIDAAFVDKIFETPPTAMWHPNIDEMLQAKVVTAQAPFGTLPASPQGSTSFEAVTASLLTRPLWALAQKTDQGLYDKAVDDVWRGVNIGLSEEAARQEPTEAFIDKAFDRQKTAPDAMLTNIMDFLGELAFFERHRNYEGCQEKAYLSDRQPTEREAAFQERQEKLAAELMANQIWLPPLDPEKAARQFRGLADNIARQGRIDFSADGVGENECRMGMQTLEAIWLLDPKRRIKAYRAMLSMPKPE